MAILQRMTAICLVIAIVLGVVMMVSCGVAWSKASITPNHSKQRPPGLVTSDIPNYSEAWFLEQMRPLVWENKPKLVMQLAYLGLQIHADSTRLRILLVHAASMAGRCDWVRVHMLKLRKDGESPRFRQMARDVIYSCFGGWQPYFGMGLITSVKHATDRRHDQSQISAEPGSLYHDHCRALGALCDPASGLKTRNMQTSRQTMWLSVSAINYRSIGIAYDDQLLLQVFKGVSLAGKFRAEGIRVNYRRMRPWRRKLVMTSALDAGTGWFAQDERLFPVTHFGGSVGLVYRSLKNHRLSAKFLARQHAPGRASKREVGTEFEAVLALSPRLVAGVSIKQIMHHRGRAALHSDSLQKTVSAHLRFDTADSLPLAKTHRLAVGLEVSRSKEQFALPLPYLARPYRETGRNLSVKVGLLPQKRKHAKIEIILDRNFLASPDALRPRKSSNISMNIQIFLN